MDAHFLKKPHIPLSVDKHLLDLMERYDKHGRPISVNFRELVSWIPYGDRATHMIHPYPAKLLVHIPHYFLSNDLLSQEGSKVLDPFSGSGTVLLEAVLSGRQAFGADANPLGRLISKAKTTPIDENKLLKALERLKRRVNDTPNNLPPDVVNINYWFHPRIINQLQCLLEAINKTRSTAIKYFFLTCFSSCVKKVSLADPRLSVPVRLHADKYPASHKFHKAAKLHLTNLEVVNVIDVFLKVFENNVKRNSELIRMLPSDPQVEIVSSDARNLVSNTLIDDQVTSKLKTNSIDLVITSPPYVGAQKYIRSSSLNLGWLGMCLSADLRKCEDKNIGREHYPKKEYETLLKTGIGRADSTLKRLYEINPLRAHIASKYLIEMRDSLQETHRVLKTGGHMILVAANNDVCGMKFKTQSYLKTIAEELGFNTKLRLIDDIHSRGLMTKRNKTASIITREWVLLFQKG